MLWSDEGQKRHLVRLRRVFAKPSGKKYLVVDDTVSGGTGYLKQLTRSDEPLMEVFKLALEALKACRCQEDPEKDGYYQCLYAYKRTAAE